MKVIVKDTGELFAGWDCKGGTMVPLFVHPQAHPTVEVLVFSAVQAGVTMRALADKAYTVTVADLVLSKPN